MRPSETTHCNGADCEVCRCADEPRLARKEIIGPATLYLGDCREIAPNVPGANIVITDPPYGVTDHEWDVPIEPDLWMLAPGCLSFAAEPFTSELIYAARRLPFRYDLVWAKNTASNAMNAKIRPLREHEQILVFGDMPYFPQKRKRSMGELLRLNAQQRESMEYASPGSVLHFEAVNNRSGNRTSHPSQKPVDLMRWLVKTYSEPSALILDPFMGSGTTGVACILEERRFVGIELNAAYFDLACERIADAQRQQRMFG